MEKILLVDDNDGLREQMKWALNGSYQVFEAATATSCLTTFSAAAPKVVCLDMGLDDVPDKGLELIDSLLGLDRRVKIIVITANTSRALGTESVKRGAFDYFVKPVDIDRLSLVIERALRMIDLESSDERGGDGAGDRIQIDSNRYMIGAGESMRKLYDIIGRLAKTDVNVLIFGESGTGKELCARAIHFHSSRRNAAFIPINCGGIPENLIESELFGYVKGAFTGANSDKTGLIEAAHEGTLLLDEIGEMPKNLQVKLLRFLEDQKLQRLGDTEFRSVDVRVIAATNRKDIGNTSGHGLRSDLFYRLSEFQIDMPPLRDRGDDVLLIAKTIIERFRAKFGLQRLELSPRAEKSIMHYSWPGNVRELENKLSKAAITCVNQVIEPEDLSLSASNAAGLTLKEARDMFEREFIINVLRRTEFNISEAARVAGISRPTLYDMLKKLEIKFETETRITE